MRVAFRVDASTQIGTGHLKRCLSLAQAIGQAGGEVAFAWRDHGLDCAGQIAQAGFRSLRLPPPASNAAHGLADTAPGQPAHAAWAGVTGEADVAAFVAVLGDWAPDWVVVDHYGFDARWHEAARAALGCRVAVIDDLADRAIAADLLIDHNPAPDHLAKYAGVMNRPARVLGGPRFALLGAAYRDLVAVEVGDAVDSIGVFMGGADAADHSRMALRACREAGFTGRITVATTHANPNLPALRELVASDGAAALVEDLPTLADFFAGHDLQIGAGGGATWERCRLGMPAVVLATAANQAIVTTALREARAAVTVDHPTPDTVRDAVAQLLGDPAMRLELAQGAGRLVDGRGSERVALAMARHAVTVRPAQSCDAEQVHRWRNDPATRAVSGDPSEIDLASHLRWFAASLAPDSGRQIMIGQIGDIPVGVVRFDRRGEQDGRDSFEVSIFLDPDLHGLGLGPPMLEAAERAIAALAPGPVRILAVTRPENQASQAMFRRCGYQGTTDFVKDLGGDRFPVTTTAMGK